ncbi:MAG: carboxypeptidase-like regulatory domain-containing protein [Acidobacteriota bacterium]|nr:carboxypeptidase-like regulatory domain-containing protein [Acidobacteriota bacterium]
MNFLHRRLVLGTLVMTLSSLRLSAADSVRVPVRWVGAAPAAVVHVEGLDSSNRVIDGFDAVPVSSYLEIPQSPKPRKYRFHAAGFVPADRGRDLLAFGVLLRAFGAVIVDVPLESASASASASPAPQALTIHVVEDRLPDPRGVTRTVTAFRRGEYSFPTPPGTWHLLIDDGAAAPRVVEGVRVSPGETRRIRLQKPSPAHGETCSVTDSRGKALPGAELGWGEPSTSPASALFARWIVSRNLRTARDGRVRIDRLPPSAHSWAIRLAGFRPKRVDVPARDARLGKPAERLVLVTARLRPLPTLRIHVNGRALESPAAPLSLWRVAARRGGAAAPSNDQPVWKGEIVRDAAAPHLPGGLYRAEVAVGGIVAVAEKTVDDSDEADDFQDLTVELVRKVVKGRVTRSDGPVAGAPVEAVPSDSSITPATTRLARSKTAADGSFALSFSYRGIVSITVSTEGASKTKNVDLIGDDEAETDFEFRPARVVLQAVDGKTGAPLAAAELATEFVPAGQFSEGIRVGTTDAAGELKLDDLSDGLLKVTARAKGYAPRVLRDVPVAPDGETAVPVELTRSAPFRIRVVDEFSAPVSRAEILVERDPHVRRPRQCPLKSLGRTDEGGELVLDELAGERTPAYVVAPGLTAQAFWLPGAVDPDGGPERNTADVVTAHHVASPGIRVLDAGGALREDAVLVFERNGIVVPLSVISRAAELNALRPEALFQRGDRAIHYHELLAPGRYAVEALSPRAGAEGDPTRDVRDLLGTVLLPTDSTVDLLWKENRAYPPAVPAVPQ